jgi:hypothetical protein
MGYMVDQSMRAIHINLVMAWIWILLGFLSGSVLGLFFAREDWLGGYASFKRRLYRLAHISFFGLGLANLAFFATTQLLGSAAPGLEAASWLFVAGAVTMPICCVIMAHFPKALLLFGVPVLSLVAGGVLVLKDVIKLS